MNELPQTLCSAPIVGWLKTGWNLGVISVFLAGEPVATAYAKELAKETKRLASELGVDEETRSEFLSLEKDFLAGGSLGNRQRSAGAVQLQRIAERLLAHAEAESARYLRARVRELDAAKLLEDGARAFVPNPECWKSLAESERNDLDESGRALLAGCPTASVMLSLRVVESLLRKHLFSTSAGRPEVKQSWGTILDDLRSAAAKRSTLAMAANAPGKQLIDLLTWLKDVRDSVAHPGKQVAQEDAEAIFLAVANEVLNSIAGLRGADGGKSN